MLVSKYVAFLAAQALALPAVPDSHFVADGLESTPEGFIRRDSHMRTVADVDGLERRSAFVRKSIECGRGPDHESVIAPFEMETLIYKARKEIIDYSFGRNHCDSVAESKLAQAFLCNDNPHRLQVPASQVTAALQSIRQQCFTSYTSAGRVWSQGNWNVYVTGRSMTGR